MRNGPQARRIRPALDAGFFIVCTIESLLRLQTEVALPREGRRSYRKLWMGLKFFDN